MAGTAASSFLRHYLGVAHEWSTICNTMVHVLSNCPQSYGKLSLYKMVYVALDIDTVTGWVAESWLGRYRAIVVGLVLSIVTIVTLKVGFVMLQFNWTPIPALALLVINNYANWYF